MTRRSSEGVRPDPADDRGISTPSLPVAITLVLVAGITATAAAFSLGVVDVPFGAPTEVTTEFNESIVDEDGTIVVTVTEKSSGDPIEGATVIPSSGTLSLTSAPEMTSDSNGRAVFDLGDGGNAIGIDWGATERDGTIRFEIRPPGEGLVDERENPAVTVVRG